MKRPINLTRPVPLEMRVHFDATRTFTTVTLTGQRYTGTGTAKRNPADKHNAQTGQDIAMARALRELADAIEDGGFAASGVAYNLSGGIFGRN